MKKLVILAVVTIFISAGYFGFQQYQKTEQIKQINSFEACSAAGFPVRESYPPQCSTPDGRLFTQQIGNEQAYADVIKITYPRPNQKVSSPLKIQGQARGTWFFEATFPVELVDKNNKSIAKGYATAGSEWMTEEFVPFTVELSFEKSSTEKGTLIITNANPSGLTENEKKLLMPVSF